MPVAAVDLGGTKISAALVQADGTITARVKLPIDKENTVEQIREVVRQVAGDGVSAAGIIVPGIYFAESGNVWAPNLFGQDQVPLRDRLNLPVKVVLDSDRAGYVLGEQWMGAARGLTDVVFLAVGTGIGAGIITGGRLCRGAGDIAGAVGWFALDPRKKDLYAQMGCWEAESAGPALARQLGMNSAEEFVAAVRRGNPKALGIYTVTCRYLAMGIANLVSLLNPQMVVLGGGLMQAGDLFLEPIRREMLNWAQPIAARQVRIELTELGEDAGLLGAARLAMESAP